MNQLKKLLLKQYELYPKMQLQDMVKFIYQNEFAGGHLITSEADSLKRLQEECVSLKQHSSETQFFEDIGNGLCRLNLSRLQKSNIIELQTVNRFFINTANTWHGSMDSLKNKLEVLKQCCREETLPYPIEEAEAYLSGYQNKGCPPVSHSEAFRLDYSPAYRVVKSEYRDYFEIFIRIDALLRSRKCVLVAIEGNSGAGKSTLTALIAGIYNCNIFHMDDYFLPPELKTPERLLETGGNVDYVRFKQQIISGILSGTEFQYNRYDCKKQALDKSASVVPKKLNIIEGSYSMHPTLIDYYDLKIFLSIDDIKQKERILKRDGPFMTERFLHEWIPLENQYFKGMKIREKCDLVYNI